MTKYMVYEIDVMRSIVKEVGKLIDNEIDNIRIECEYGHHEEITIDIDITDEELEDVIQLVKDYAIDHPSIRVIINGNNPIDGWDYV